MNPGQAGHGRNRPLRAAGTVHGSRGEVRRCDSSIKVKRQLPANPVVFLSRQPQSICKRSGAPDQIQLGRFQPSGSSGKGATQANHADVLQLDAGTHGARREIELPAAGIVAVEGEFERGDAVVVRARRGNEAARGLTAYSSGDIRRIAGHKSGEIAAILGYRGRDEVIHRDDLVLTG